MGLFYLLEHLRRRRRYGQLWTFFPPFKIWLVGDQNNILYPFFQSEDLWALCVSLLDRHIYGNSWVVT